MSQQNVAAEWLSDKVIMLTPSGDASWSQTFDSIEEAAYLNPWDHPVCFILDLTAETSQLKAADGREFANFFLGTIPFKSNLAVVLNENQTVSDSQVAFLDGLAANGFSIRNFTSRSGAVAWLQEGCSGQSGCCAIGKNQQLSARL